MEKVDMNFRFRVPSKMTRNLEKLAQFVVKNYDSSAAQIRFSRI